MSADPATAHSVFQNIPDTVWSGMLASLATLFGTLAGVVVTNVSTTKRLKLQLDREELEKQKERLTTLRRDLYLKAAEATIRVNAYFGDLTQINLTMPGFDAPLRDVMAVGAQLQLVVSQSTAQPISDLIAVYAELQLKLLPRVAPIHTLKANIETLSSLYENAQAEVKRVLAAMTQYNESGQRDPDLFERLNRSATFSRETSQRLANERTGLWGQVQALQRQYLRDLVPELKRSQSSKCLSWSNCAENLR